MSNEIDMPEVVTFLAGGVECKAFVMFGENYGLNLRTATVNFKKRAPDVELQPLDGFVRVMLNGGDVWLDTSAESAEAIRRLFEEGKGE